MSKTKFNKWQRMLTPFHMKDLKAGDVISYETDEHFDLYFCECDPSKDEEKPDDPDAYVIRVSHLIKDPDFK